MESSPCVYVTLSEKLMLSTRSIAMETDGTTDNGLVHSYMYILAVWNFFKSFSYYTYFSL